VAALALALLAPSASAAGLGPDAANSPNADSIRTAYWVMLAVALVLGAALIAGLLVAARRFRARDDAVPRRLTAARGTAGRVGAGLGVLAVAMFVFGVVMTEDARDASADESAESLDIGVVGQQWLWRFEYPQDSESSTGEEIATVFSYGELVVPVDTTVNLAIDSTDVMHRWFIPALGGQVQAVPGEVAETSFHAEEEGVYEGRSTQFSGTGYPAMRAKVRVVSAAEYEEYIQTLAEELSEAQAEVAGESAAESPDAETPDEGAP